MGLLSNLFSKNDTSSDVLNDPSYIKSYKHIVGPWHQYDFFLTGGYGWDYILDSAKYMISADLDNVGTISVTSLAGANIECVNEYRQNGGRIDLIEEVKNESSMLGVGGMSKAASGAPIKIVWINQTRVIRIMSPVDDEEFMIRYVESVVRRNFNTANALKKGNSVIEKA